MPTGTPRRGFQNVSRRLAVMKMQAAASRARVMWPRLSCRWSSRLSAKSLAQPQMPKEPRVVDIGGRGNGTQWWTVSGGDDMILDPGFGAVDGVGADTHHADQGELHPTQQGRANPFAQAAARGGAARPLVLRTVRGLPAGPRRTIEPLATIATVQEIRHSATLLRPAWPMFRLRRTELAGHCKWETRSC